MGNLSQISISRVEKESEVHVKRWISRGFILLAFAIAFYLEGTDRIWIIGALLGAIGFMVSAFIQNEKRL